MEKKFFSFEFEEISAREIESSEIRELLRRAEDVVPTAHAVYSGFKVGCSLLLENGTYICASNQENAAYPSGMCAERSALYYYGSHGRPYAIKAMAITADKITGNFLAPCGACRQAMLEYARLQNTPIAIYFRARESGQWIFVSDLKKLMPFPFDAF